MKPSRFGFVMMLCMLWVLGGGISLQAQTEIQILPEGGERGEAFGCAVDVSDGQLIVGACWNDALGQSAGKIYLFCQVNETWIQEAALYGSQIHERDYFGSRVAIGDGWAFASAQENLADSTCSGSVYVFQKVGDNWTEHSRLSGTGPRAYRRFGGSIDYDQGWLAVGAIGEDNYTGKVYLYQQYGSGWILSQQLQPAALEELDNFGSAVRLSNGYLAVGAIGDDDLAIRSGAVYVFQLDNGSWTFLEKVLPPESMQNMGFGADLAIEKLPTDSPRLAVKAADMDRHFQLSKVYVYNRLFSAFELESTMASAPDQSMDRFGWGAVALGGDRLAIGAQGHCDWYGSQGKAYLYRENGSNWEANGMFYARDPIEYGYYGSSVALDDTHLFVGSLSSHVGDSTGVVTVYRLTPEPVIVSCADVPHDQGGVVSLSWDASYLDVGQSVSHYSVWRALPNGQIGKASVSNPCRQTQESGRTYYWEWLADQPAHRDAAYMMAAPTLYDSMSTTFGMHYFRVSAHLDDGSRFFDSAIDSAYSVDNLAPPAPEGLAGVVSDEGVLLTWRASSAPDVLRYCIYRNGEATHFTSDCFWTDLALTGGEEAVYAVSAVDVHENEGPSCPDVTVFLTGVAEPSSLLPKAVALLPNYPNPFNPQTTLAFELPKAGRVTLSVFDSRGRRVAVLADAFFPAGRHQAGFDAQDLASGVYVCQLVQGEVVLHRKILYLK